MPWLCAGLFSPRRYTAGASWTGRVLRTANSTLGLLLVQYCWRIRFQRAEKRAATKSGLISEHSVGEMEESPAAIQRHSCQDEWVLIKLLVASFGGLQMDCIITWVADCIPHLELRVEMVHKGYHVVDTLNCC